MKLFLVLFAWIEGFYFLTLETTCLPRQEVASNKSSSLLLWQNCMTCFWESITQLSKPDYNIDKLSSEVNQAELQFNSLPRFHRSIVELESWCFPSTIISYAYFILISHEEFVVQSWTVFVETDFTPDKIFYLAKIVSVAVVINQCRVYRIL